MYTNTTDIVDVIPQLIYDVFMTNKYNQIISMPNSASLSVEDFILTNIDADAPQKDYDVYQCDPANKKQQFKMVHVLNDLMYSNDLNKKELEISLIEEERNFANRLNVYNSKISWFLILLLAFIVAFIFYEFQKRKK
jgi:hypothetical protein